jgi:hypothetical protein
MRLQKNRFVFIDSSHCLFTMIGFF